MARQPRWRYPRSHFDTLGRLQNILQLAEENGATLAILDTAPHTEIAALDAARVSDMAFVPCKPALIDLQAIGSTIDVVNLAKVPAHIVLNAVPPRGDLAEQARQAVETYMFRVLPARSDIGSVSFMPTTQG